MNWNGMEWNGKQAINRGNRKNYILHEHNGEREEYLARQLAVHGVHDRGHARKAQARPNEEWMVLAIALAEPPSVCLARTSSR
jgi:hypothetical protein